MELSANLSIGISLRIITYASYCCDWSFATLPQPLDAPKSMSNYTSQLPDEITEVNGDSGTADDTSLHGVVNVHTT